MSDVFVALLLIKIKTHILWSRHAVAQLVEALRFCSIPDGVTGILH
jgi:hypothetical protein